MLDRVRRLMDRLLGPHLDPPKPDKDLATADRKTHDLEVRIDAIINVDARRAKAVAEHVRRTQDALTQR